MTLSFTLLLQSLFLALALLSDEALGSAVQAPGFRRRPLAVVGVSEQQQRLLRSHSFDLHTSSGIRGGGGKASTGNNKPPAFLRRAYALCGLATTTAWTTVVLTTIRSNQPLGAMMPTFQHGFFARIGALSAVPLIVASFSTLAASCDSWEKLGSTTCRRHNLALTAAGIGSALWVGFAPILTRIPGSNPLVSHQVYTGAIRSGLIGCYGSAALLSAAVWIRSLPTSARRDPFSWPGRIADGVLQSLVSLAPDDVGNPVNVKYAVLASSFLVFTGLQFGSHPLSVIPSWTGRRLARAFPAWTLLAAVASFDLKEAVEDGKNTATATLSRGLKGFGSVYLTAKVGAIFLDPSFPASYHAVQMVPAWATVAIAVAGLTLRSDTKKGGK